MTQIREQQFVDTFVRLTPSLQTTFRKVIQTFKNDKVTTADDLLQITAEQAWQYLQLPQYDHYQIEVLIWLRAAAVRSAYIQSAKKTRFLDHPSSEVPGYLPTPIQFLLRLDVLHYINNHKDPTIRRICFLLREGWTYRQISKVVNLSDGAIKMRVNRLKQEISIQDLRPD